MNIQSTNIIVADYCEAMARKEIMVNKAYQRSDKVWPPAARSFLIESILLNFPVPKLSLYPVTDLKSRKTVREIVDGQQRSMAIFDYYNDRFAISRSSKVGEIAGKSYSQLDDELKERFLTYSLSIDQFLSATPDEIREVFRRINSYMVPLNPEELRHARYQGAFKWFIYNLSSRHDQNLVNMGVFGDPQIVRMADAKLYAEVIHAILHGITTTNAKKLDGLYEDYDRDFPFEEDIWERIERCINFLLGIEEIHQSALMKPYNFYSLVLAIMHAMNPVERLSQWHHAELPYVFERDIVVSNLSALAAALDAAVVGTKFDAFLAASTEKTNVAEQRAIRFTWFCRALQRQLL